MNPVYQIEPSGAAIGSCGNESAVGRAHSWNDTFSVPGRITAGGAGCGRAIAERFADKIIAIEEEFAKAPLTIAHGDLRYDNLYFGADGMAVADWQIIVRARGPYDVGYFMSQSLQPAERKACEMDILRAYHEKLLAHGVTDYSFGQCFDDYRISAMFCLVYPVISGGTLDLANHPMC